MSTLKQRLQEKYLLKLDSESSNTTDFINDVLTSKKYSTELTPFENKFISIFFGKGSEVCCYELFYNANEMLIKRINKSNI
jgi:hypothetical protein